MEEHRHFLWQTLELAERAAAQVAPNPMVGAIIVRAGEVIATGYHQHYGGPHAEAVALATAGQRARGATLYCNLEPCSYRCTHKHQPPCTAAIIRAGIARVVIGQLDPNPRVCGSGVRTLAEAGIEVLVAPEEDQAPFWRFNAPFNTAMGLQRPFVHLKSALSLDGRIATRCGDSRWISSAAAREEVHQLRGRYQAVLVGVGTVIHDNPQLTVRLTTAADRTPDRGGPSRIRQPRAVVIDPQLRIPRDSFLVQERAHELIVCCAPDASTARAADLHARGVTVVPIPTSVPHPAPSTHPSTHPGTLSGARSDFHASTPSGALLNLPALLTVLFERGIRSILLEGGAKTTTAFLRAQLVDRLSFYTAPIIVGSGVEAIGDLSTARIAEALRFEAPLWRTLDDQAVFEGFRSGWLAEVSARTEERLCLPA